MTVWAVFTPNGSLYAVYRDRLTAERVAASISGRVEETILI